MLLGIVPLYNIDDLKETVLDKRGIDLSKFNYIFFAKRAIDYGFRLIEITGDIYHFIPGSFSEETMDKLRVLKEDRKIEYTVHLPIWSVELSSPNKKIRDASVEAVIDTINKFEELKPLNYVIHTFGALASEFSRLKVSKETKRYILMFFQGFAAESLERILEETGIKSKRLAIETVEFPWDLTYELVEAFDTSICYDTGHLFSGQPGLYDPLEFLEDNYEKILEIHLHDAIPKENPDDFMYRDHLPLGEGKLPYCELIKRLLERGFKGGIVFELGKNEVLKSMLNLKDKCGFRLSDLGFYGDLKWL